MFNLKRFALRSNNDRSAPQLLSTTPQRRLPSWLYCMVPTTLVGTIMFIIAAIIVLSLIPLYLNQRTAAAEIFVSPLLNITFLLPGTITSGNTRAASALIQGNLNNNQLTLLGQILQDNIDADSKLKNTQVNVSQGFITSTSTGSKRQLDGTSQISKASQQGDMLTIYQIGQGPAYPDQLVIFFQLLCRRPCKRDLISYVFQNTFDHFDINATMYSLLFIDQLSTTTLIASTNVSSATTVSGQPNVTPDLTMSSIVLNVKDTEIIQVNGVTLFGEKDYSGNVQSVYAIQTATAIYIIQQDRIVQIQTADDAFTFDYTSIDNQYIITLSTENSSYEMPLSYETPNITFPKPVFLYDLNASLPDPFTGVLLEVADVSTGQLIDDAIVLMNYHDEQLGNRSVVMTNVGGGQYYSVLPTDDKTINDYFNMTNLLSTIGQQSNALIALMRSYPIANICAQIPEMGQSFCEVILQDMTVKIPDSLNIASKYNGQISMQSKPPGELIDFEVAVSLPGQEPETTPLDSSNEINSSRLARRANTGYSINPNVQTKFRAQVKSSKGKFNNQNVAGGGGHYSQVINIGKSHTTVNFRYQTYEIADQIDVYYMNQPLFSTGCIGTNGEEAVVLSLDGDENSLLVNVFANCQSSSRTEWYYIVECPVDKLICDTDLCYCGDEHRKSITTKKPTYNGCGAEGSILNRFIEPNGEANKFTPSCNDHDICYGTCNTRKTYCDQKFLHDAQASCYKNWEDSVDIQRCSNNAYLFYIAIKNFGGNAYEEAQKFSCACPKTG